MLGQKFEMICEEIEGIMAGMRDKYDTAPEHFEKNAVRELRECIRDVFKKHVSRRYKDIFEKTS